MVKFVSEMDKRSLLSHRKKLQNDESVKESIKANEKLEDTIRVMEDLTEARRRIMNIAKTLPEVEFTFVQHGNIMCKMIGGFKGPKFVKVNNTEALWELGVDVVDRDIYNNI